MPEPKRGCCFAGHFDFGEHRRLPSHSGEESCRGIRSNNWIMTSIGIGFGIGLRERPLAGEPTPPEPGEEITPLLEDGGDILLEDNEPILLEKQN